MSSPSIPNPADAAVAGMTEDVRNFPFQYQINSLAQTGGKATINGRTYDFTGLGNADVAGKTLDQTAQAMLDIKRNYDPQYIQQRLEDLKRSDPQGYQARQDLFDKILSDSREHPNRPMATDLQNQVDAMLKTSGQLDPQALQEVKQGVRGGQVARGITLGNAPASQEANAVVGASDALRKEQQGVAENYLASGISPQDVEYRRIQQSLSNLGAFQNNETPQAEFGQLSGAQGGAAPFNPVNYSNPAQLNPQGSAAAGINFANSQYGYQNSQSNPWLAGISTGASAFGAASNFMRPSPYTMAMNNYYSSPTGMNPTYMNVAPAYQPTTLPATGSNGGNFSNIA